MINIKQLSAIDPSRWPNVIHMGYMTEVMRRTAQEWTAQNPCPAKLQPYLTAVRIVSLDPKAEKAGGLAVALKGVIVRPNDEVDAEKEYGLVSYSE